MMLDRLIINAPFPVAAIIVGLAAAGALAYGNPQPDPAAIAERTVTTCVMCVIPAGARPGDELRCREAVP